MRMRVYPVKPPFQPLRGQKYALRISVLLAGEDPPDLADWTISAEAAAVTPRPPSGNKRLFQSAPSVALNEALWQLSPDQVRALQAAGPAQLDVLLVDDESTPFLVRVLLEVQDTVADAPAAPSPGPAVVQLTINRATDEASVQALGAGPAGKSAYDLWLLEGNEGTVLDFLASLQGEGFNWREQWDGVAVYATGDVVHDEGSAWIAIAPSEGEQPSDESEIWSLLVRAADVTPALEALVAEALQHRNDAYGFATAAGLDAQTAGEQATLAIAAALLASQWADQEEDTPVEEDPDRFSAFHWAQKAAAAVSAALGAIADALASALFGIDEAEALAIDAVQDEGATQVSAVQAAGETITQALETHEESIGNHDDVNLAGQQDDHILQRVGGIWVPRVVAAGVTAREIAAGDLGRIVLWDEYDRASLGTAPSGQTYLATGSAWTIDQAQARPPSSSVEVLYADTGHVNVEAQAVLAIAIVTRFGGLALRIVDEDNYLRVVYRDNQVRIMTRIAGSDATPMSSAISPIIRPDQLATVRAYAINDNGTIIIRGSVEVGGARVVVSHTISDAGEVALFESSTLHGVHLHHSGARLDSLVIRRANIL